jgi:hypothetical protein
MNMYPHSDTGIPNFILFSFLYVHPMEKKTALSMQSKLCMCTFVLAMSNMSNKPEVLLGGVKLCTDNPGIPG